MILIRKIQKYQTLKSMSIQSNAKKSFILYVMLFITLFSVAAVIIYLSHSSTTEETLRTDKNLITLNGP